MFYDRVFEMRDGKPAGRVLLRDDLEELPCALGLGQMYLVELSLENGCSFVGLLGLAFSGRDNNIQDENLVNHEFLLLDLLVKCLAVEDHKVVINQVLLDLVGKDTLNGVHLVGVADLTDFLGNFTVFITRAHQT